MVRDLQRQVAALAGVVDHRLHRQVGGTLRPGSLAEDLFRRNRLVADLLQGEVAEVVVRPRGVEKIAGEQRVDVESRQPDAMAPQDESGPLQVVAGLRHAGVGKRLRQRA